jgi:cytoplasmic iron level regulating protein YaaA (DUF328/UPF0246 family)
MKIILSPAKMMRSLPTAQYTVTKNLAHAQYLQKILSKWTLKEFEQKMKLSRAKAIETKQMIQDWHALQDQKQLTPALFAYIGEAFKALDVVSCDQKALSYFNQNVCVLSGIYGLLCATDGIAPYRLEMAQKITLSKKQTSLYAFWRPKVELLLHELLSADEQLLNLASIEYSDLIQDAALKSKMITPVFKERKAGKLQSISVFSKQARGTMSRWCANEGIEDVAQIKNFSELGYAFEASLSDSSNYYFVRAEAL